MVTGYRCQSQSDRVELVKLHIVIKERHTTVQTLSRIVRNSGALFQGAISNLTASFFNRVNLFLILVEDCVKIVRVIGAIVHVLTHMVAVYLLIIVFTSKKYTISRAFTYQHI